MNCPFCSEINPDNAQICRSCGSSLAAATPLEMPSGTRLKGGKYRITRYLAHGGFGIIYVATQTGRKKQIAIKEFFPDGIATRDANSQVLSNVTASQWQTMLHRFEREAAVLRELKHPSSTKLLDCWQERGTAFMALELIKGETLEKRLQQGALPLDEALKIFSTILEVLQELHQKRLLHRDIKPANIILGNTRVELLDFGSVTEFTPQQRMQVSSRLLTPEYAPLEQFGELVTLAPATDLYALAVTLCEAVAGVRPPSALQRANGATLDTVLGLVRSRSAPLADLIKKALALRLEDRFSSAEEMLNELQAIRLTLLLTRVSTPTVPADNIEAQWWIVGTAGLMIVSVLFSPLHIIIKIFLAITLPLVQLNASGLSNSQKPSFGNKFIALLFPALVFFVSSALTQTTIPDSQKPLVAPAPQTITAPAPQAIAPPANQPIKPQAIGDYRVAARFDYLKGISNLVISGNKQTLFVSQFGNYTTGTQHFLRLGSKTIIKPIKQQKLSDQFQFSMLDALTYVVLAGKNSFWTIYPGGAVQRLNQDGKLLAQTSSLPILRYSILSSDEQLLFVQKVELDDLLYPKEKQNIVKGIVVFDAQNLRQKRILPFDPAGSWNLVAARDQTIFVLVKNNQRITWLMLNAQTGQVMRQQELPELTTDNYVLRYDKNSVYIAVSSSSSTNKKVYAYKWLESGELVQRWAVSEKKQSTCDMWLSPDGQQLLLSGSPKALEVLRTSNGQVLRTFSLLSSHQAGIVMDSSQKQGQVVYSTEPDFFCDFAVDAQGTVYANNMETRQVLTLVPR